MSKADRTTKLTCSLDRVLGCMVAAISLTSLLLAGATSGFAQSPIASPTATPTGSAALAASSPLSARAGKSLTQPLWTDLTAEQKIALRPLYADWASMPVPQKRKWIEVTKDFGKMTVADQTKYQSRMSAWSALSPQQRAQARLNFADVTGQMTADERKSKWQAYQALSPEEKQRLRVAGKGEQTKSIALAPKPVASDRLAAVPKPIRTASVASGSVLNGKTSPKIALVAKPMSDSLTTMPATATPSAPSVQSLQPVQTPVTPP